MTIHAIHGFNVFDGGERTLGALRPYFNDTNFNLYSYGWTFLLRLRKVNKRTVNELKERIYPGDTVIAHSNGCLIAWELIEAGAPIRKVICIQPSLRRDTEWKVPYVCFYNPGDRVVLLGRAWGRFVSTWRFHGWGAAGHYGFMSPNGENINTMDSRIDTRGHSTIFRPEHVHYWGPIIRQKVLNK